MATITLKGNEIHTVGELPSIGQMAPDFLLVASDLSEKGSLDYKNKIIILNIFPSIDTSTCAMSVRKFNEKVNQTSGAVVLCISKDLPFAQSRFCAAEGLENVVPLSSFRSNFGNQYGVEIKDGPLKGLLSRAIVVIDKEGKVVYKQQVPEIADEPDYESVLKLL